MELPDAPVISGATRVRSIRILVLYFTLSMKDHIVAKLTSYASSIYAPRKLKVHGLSHRSSIHSFVHSGYFYSASKRTYEQTAKGYISLICAIILDFSCCGGQM